MKETIAAIATAIVGLAVVAVIVSKNSQTGTVLTDAGTAFSSLIKAATGPVTAGGTSLGNLTY